MAIISEHASIILKRVSDSQDPSEQIVLISGKDKQRVPIHRVILNAASKFFTDLMGQNFQEDKPKEFAFIDDSDGETIKNVVNFCYTGGIDLTEENAEKILKVATSAEIDLLEDKCRQFYATKLSVANAVNFWIVADKYRFEDLQKRAYDLIFENFETISTTDVRNLSTPLLQQLLKCDKIQDYGDLLATRLLEWFHSDEDERSVYMPELLKLIRLEKLTGEFLGNKFEPIFKRFKCFDLVIADYRRRAMNPCANAVVPRMRSIFQVLEQTKGESDAKYSVVKIVKSNDSSPNHFKDVAEVSVGQRTHFGVFLHKNRIFVLGGLGGVDNESPLKSGFSYDLNSGKRDVLAVMNKSRQLATKILVGNYIYVFGGRGESGILNSCERFDTEKNTWEAIKPMIDARHFASATVINGYIYVAGGGAYYNKPKSTSVELYDPKTDEWMSLNHMKKARENFVLVELNGFLYAMGGYDKSVERFDPLKNRWTEIEPFHGSDRIASAINVDGTLFGVMRNGDYGRIEIDQSGKCSFVLLSASKNVSGYFQRHDLYLD